MSRASAARPGTQGPKLATPQSIALGPGSRSGYASASAGTRKACDAVQIAKRIPTIVAPHDGGLRFRLFGKNSFIVNFTIEQYFMSHDIVISGGAAHAPLRDAEANVE